MTDSPAGVWRHILSFSEDIKHASRHKYVVQGEASAAPTQLQAAMQSSTPGAAGILPSPFLEVSPFLLIA